MLVYLGLAVRNRSEGFRRMWIYVALAGGVLGAIATIMFTIGTSAEISSFLDGPAHRRPRRATSATPPCSSPRS